MHIDVTLYPSELKRIDQKGKTIVVIDVLRGSSTIIHALAHGCKEIHPVPDVKTAWQKRKALNLTITHNQKNKYVLIGGERNGFRTKGFDLGNSPQEYTAEKIAGKTLVFTTTNCTKTLKLCKNPTEVLICAFLNANAVSKYLASKKRDIIFALSGRSDTYSMEDMICAGMVINEISKSCKVLLSDTAISAKIIYKYYKGHILKGLLDSFHGQYLKKIGMEDDIILCAKAGRFDIIPRYSNGLISLY